MNHRSKKLGFGRLVLAWLMCASAGSAMAQLKNVTPASPAQALACLQRPAEKLRFPEKHKHDTARGFMRVGLHFDAPDRPPRVEVLVNTAREDMQSLVRAHVEQYRLPCWTPDDGGVSAVQEFRFSNIDHPPQALLHGVEAAQLCLVRPDKDPDIGFLNPTSVQHLFVTMTFEGNGSAPPVVKTIYSSTTELLEQEAKRWAAQYRMPCRTAGDRPLVVRQHFQFVPNDRKRYVLKQSALGFVEFLRMTKGLESLRAEFDFNTMNCPFPVRYTTYAPHLPNEVDAYEPPDLNRVAFLDWLAERQLNFANEQQANDLFGSTLQIQVPCGRLDLKPQPSPNQ